MKTINEKTEVTQEIANTENCATFTVEQPALVNALTMLAAAVAKRSMLPILQNVKFAAMPLTQKLLVSATNLEIFAKIHLPAQVDMLFAFTVDYKELLAVIKPLKKAQLTFTLQSEPLQEGSTFQVQSVRVSGAGMTVTLPVIAATEFPYEPAATDETCLPEQHLAGVPVSTFRKMINAVAPAASENLMRPTFTGIHIRLERDRFTMEATDGFRVHRMHETIAGAKSWARSLIVDAKSLYEVARRLPKTGEVALESHSSTHATLTCGNAVVHFRLIEGTYPNTEMAIPRAVDLTRFLRVDCAPLKTAIDALASIAKESSNRVCLQMGPAGLIVAASHDGMAEPMRVSVPAIVEGKASEVCFNYRYLGAVLEVAPTSKLICSFSKLRDVTHVHLDTVPGFEAVLMPMRVK